MTNSPWGPHGPQTPPHTVTPNPTAPGPTQPLLGSDGGAGAGAPPIATGGGALHLGDIAASIVVSLILFVLLWIPIACLYPLTSLAGITAGFGSASLFARVLPPDLRDAASVLGFGIGLVVVLKVFRVEGRLAERPAFQRFRHLVRMVLLAVWAIPIIQLSTGVTAPSTSTRFIFAVVTSPRAMLTFLARPMYLGIWLAVVVGLHLLLTKGERARRWWHRRLRWLGLKVPEPKVAASPGPATGF